MGLGAALWLIASLVAAPQVSTRYVAESWTVREGLPQSSVTDIAEDDDGFIWVSTFGGVARFDGESFHRADPPQSQGDFDGHRFVSIAIDGDTVFAGAESGRVFRFSRFLRNAAAVRAIALPRSGIVRDLAIDDQHRLWVAADDAGLFAVDAAGAVVVDRDFKEPVYSVDIAHEGDVRVGLSHRVVELDPHDLNGAPRAETQTTAPIADIVAASTGAVVVDDLGIHPLVPHAIVPTTEQTHLTRITERAGTWWLAGSEGLTIVNGEMERRVLLPVRRATGARAGDDRPWIRRMLIAHDGALWLGSNDAGLFRVRDRGVRQLGQQVGLRGDSVLLVAPRPDAGAWVSSYCHGLQLLGADDRITTSPAVKDTACISALHVESDRVVYGSVDGDIVRVDDAGAHVIVDHTVIDAGGVYAIDVDAGGLWVGTKRRGLLHFDARGQPDGRVHGAAPLDVRVIARRPGGGWFIGAVDGVYVVDTDGNVRSITTSSRVHQVRDLLPIDDDHVWAVTYGSGLHALSTAGEDVGFYEADGFCDDVLSRVIALDGELWFNGNRGVFRVAAAVLDDAVARRRTDPRAPLFLPCTRLDTGEGNGGGGGAGGRLADGRLVFPTVDGIAVVDPTHWAQQAPLPAVHIASANVDGFELSVDGVSEVPAGPHHLEVQVITPSFDAERPLFERRHVHGDVVRIETGTSAQLDYSGLLPGLQTLEVRRVSLDGRRGPPATLRFRLSPRITETVAFRLGGPLGALSIIAVIASVWLRALRTKNRLLRAEVERDAVYRVVFDRSPCALFLHAPSGELVQLNTAAIAMVGPVLPAQRALQASTSTSTPSTTPALPFIAEPDRDRYRSLLMHTGPLTSRLDEVHMLTPEGKLRTVLVECTRLVLAGVPRTLVAALDITAIRAAEAERTALLERTATSVRLEGLGRLAGGIAHDFNNVLAALRLQVEVLSTAVNEPATVRELVTEMLQAVDQGRDLTRRFLIFGRPTAKSAEESHEEVSLSACVERCAPLLRRLLRPGLSLELHANAGSAAVNVDPAHLDQVLMNLVLNAQHASGASGAILVRTTRDEPLPSTAHEILPAPAGPTVRLWVEDQGCGMTPEVLARAFEPFFSTRGSGSGIGLTVVQRVAQGAGAGVHVITTPGAGTAVVLTFRDVKPEQKRTPGSVDVVAPRAPRTRRCTCDGTKPTVLIVDDEDFVRDALALVLARAGYAVVDAVDGHDALVALDELAAARQHVDLVITDFVMPNATGAELIAHLQLKHPTLPVVLLSGFTGEAQLPAGVPLVQKPVDAARLLALAAELLAARPSTATTTSSSSTASA